MPLPPDDAPEPTDAPLRPHDRRPRARALDAIAVALLAAVPLLPTLRARFMYDDTTLIRDNPWMNGWGELLRAWHQPYWPTTGPDVLGLYRPLQIAVLATLWNASGGEAFAFHAYAVLLSVLTAVGVWWLVRRGASADAAVAAALFFATHPLHVEPVASVANSSELLVTLFTIALVRVLADGRGEGTPMPWGRALAVGALSAAALLSKESGLLALPVALASVWGWRRGVRARVSAQAVLRANARGIGIATVLLVAALLARHAVLGATVSRTSIAAQGLQMATGARIGMMLSLWPHVAGMLAWPTGLAPYYGPTLVPAHALGLAVASALVVGGFIALTIVLAARGERRLFVAVCWIVLTYLPASNLLVATGQILSDRTLYGATVGAALLLACLVDAFPGFARRMVLAFAALLVAHGLVESTRYALAWTSHRALWTRLVEAQPNEHLGYKLLGMDARARGEHERAVQLLGRAHAMAPADRQIRFEYGQALFETGRFEEAATTLGALLRDADVRGEPGFVSLYLEAVGRARGAPGVVEAATPLLASSSGGVAALYAGLAEEQLGRPAAADSVYAQGLRVSPGDSALLARRARLAHP